MYCNSPKIAGANCTLQKLNDKKKHSVNGAFTACTAGTSLLETVTDAAEIAAQTATILLSTARSSFDEFQNARKCGQKLYILVKSISWGQCRTNPNISGGMTAQWH
jgi:UDP-N-acetylmuramoylalanine-D-glutamate ligase